MPTHITVGMATKTYVSVLDDLDGTEGAETVSFAVEGVAFEIDLNEKNKNKLLAALRPYTENGRRVGGRAKRGANLPREATGRGRQQLGQHGATATMIRQWAQQTGVNVGDKGRIPSAVIEEYDKAQSAPKPQVNGRAKTPRKPARAKATADA